MELNGINSQTNSVAIREKIYNAALRAELEPYLMAQQFVDVISGFTDGEKFIDIEVGNATVHDYVEGTDIVLEGLDMADREFTINQYRQSGHYITEKFTQDSYVSAKIAAVVPAKEARALAADLETKIFGLQSVLQTAGSDNKYEGIPHRWIAGWDAASANHVWGSLTVSDFAMAATALHKIGYFGPMIAIIPTYQEYCITQNAAFKGALAFQPLYGKVFQDGAITGSRFAFNCFGFDIYVSNFTPVVASESSKALDGTSKTITGAGVACLFANIPGMRPWRMAWRMMPKFEGAWNMYKRRQEFVTVERYGIGKGETPNFVGILCYDNPDSNIA